jgi:hypothetical protein
LSFLSALENDGKHILSAIETGLHFAIQAAPVAGDVVSLFNPAAGALISLIGTKVIAAENQITEAKAGTKKKAFVMAGLSDALTFGYAIQGKPVPPDALAGVSNAVDAFVALLNAVQQGTGAKV